MKTLLFLILPLMLCSFSNVKPNNTLNDQNLKGKVKSITEYTFYDTIANKFYDKTVLLYDKNGNEVAQQDYTYNHGLFDTTTVKWDYRYNENGVKTEENIYNKDGSLSWKTVYKYDKIGNVIEANRYHNTGKLEEKYVYRYDNNGKNIEVVSYSSKGTINCKTTNKYDENGNLTATIEDCSYIPWLLPGRVKSNTEYDKKGYALQSSEYDRKNNITSSIKRSEMSFDSKGNLVKWIETRLEHGHEYEVLCKQEISYY